MDLQKFRDAIGKHTEWLNANRSKLEEDIIQTSIKINVLEKLSHLENFDDKLDVAKKRVAKLLDTKKWVDNYAKSYFEYVEDDAWKIFFEHPYHEEENHE